MDKKSGEKKSVETAEPPQDGVPEIMLWIQSYDDIFSDFDSRPYYQRALSEDFLHEVRNASLDKPLGRLRLRFIIPANRRDIGSEKRIKMRIQNHAHKHNYLMRNEMRRVLGMGLWFILSGIIIMFLGWYLDVHGLIGHSFGSFMMVLLEPAGWFLTWEGLNIVVFDRNKKRPEREFYEKFAQCDIHFSSY